MVLLQHEAMNADYYTILENHSGTSKWSGSSVNLRPNLLCLWFTSIVDGDNSSKKTQTANETQPVNDREPVTIAKLSMTIPLPMKTR